MPTGAELTMIAQAAQNNPISQAQSAILPTAMGIALGAYQDKRQYKQAEKLQALQIAGSKELTDYNANKQLQMWKDTSYGPQVEQMQKAGINPALMYGMGGGGGQSANVNTGTVGHQAAAPGGGIEGMIGMGLQLGMMQAQKRVLETQAMKNEAEAKKTSGVDTAATQMSIKSMAQGINNALATERLTKLDADLKEVSLRIAKATEQEAVDIIDKTALKMTEELDKLSRENIVDKATMETRIDIMRANLLTIGIQNALTKAQTASTYAHIGFTREALFQKAEEIVQKWRELEMQGGRDTTEKMKAFTQQAAVDLQEFRLPIDVVEKIMQAVFLKSVLSPSVNPVRGFHNR